MQASIVNVWESLPIEKRDLFDDAIELLVYKPIDFKSADEVAKFEQQRKDSVHGKTGEQIIAAAAQILEQQRQQQEPEYREIKELEAKRQLVVRSRDQLRKFKVLRSLYYKERIEFKFLGIQPVIEVTARNETSHTVSKVYFKGVIENPEQDVTWFQDRFTCSIPSGLKPGEEISWRLAPNSSSGWGIFNAPPDVIFTAIVERLDGADGKILYSNTVFGKREEQRLSELKKKYKIN
ncbi:MAG: hypothetical protein OEY01_07600 [Desulfobulbaceae bacterium]|nr:hypothetical protein [Desulfobulbaceae bacterium]HIJ78918.1 hypothetical protein [Deltaproteobacteria bacterium]